MKIDRECGFESRLVVNSLVTRQAGLHITRNLDSQLSQ